MVLCVFHALLCILFSYTSTTEAILQEITLKPDVDDVKINKLSEMPWNLHDLYCCFGKYFCLFVRVNQHMHTGFWSC